MSAFQKVCSGIPEMDKALNYIRLGNNVVQEYYYEHCSYWR